MHLDGKHLVAKSHAMEQVDSQLQLQLLLKSKTQSQVKLSPDTENLKTWELQPPLLQVIFPLPLSN